ncbi:MAG: hypothetical protein ACOX8V_05250 [Thermoleophilia bacterium]
MKKRFWRTVAVMMVGSAIAVALGGPASAASKWEPPNWALGDPALVETMEKAHEYEYGQLSHPLDLREDRSGLIPNPITVREGAFPEDAVVDVSPGESDKGPQPKPTAVGFVYDATDAMYTTTVEVQSTGATGVKADVYVTPRAAKYDFFFVNMRNVNNGSQVFSFEVTRQLELDGQYHWRPFVHIIHPSLQGGDFQKIYDGNGSGQQGILHGPAIEVSQNAWHNLKMAKSSSTGLFTVYLDGTPVEYNLSFPVPLTSLIARTSWEGVYETAASAVNPLGSHHDNIWLRTSDYSTWSKWTEASWDDTTFGSAQLILSGQSIGQEYPPYAPNLYRVYSPNFYKWQQWDTQGPR